MHMEHKNYIYILECGDKSLYTGWTNDLERRIKQHSRGRGGRYTRSHLPVRMVYCECFETRQEAMSREYAIKQMSKQEKLELINKARS